jgi:hypothetical protein
LRAKYGIMGGLGGALFGRGTNKGWQARTILLIGMYVAVSPHRPQSSSKEF